MISLGAIIPWKLQPINQLLLVTSKKQGNSVLHNLDLQSSVLNTSGSLGRNKTPLFEKLKQANPQ